MRVLCRSFAGLLLLVAIGSQSALYAEPLKVGFVFNSPIGDSGWTYQHNQGRLVLEENLGGQVETTHLESITEMDAERVLRGLVNEGHELIFTTSFGFMNPTIKVAKTAPNVVFQHATGYKLADNVGVYHARAYEARYLSGILAGGISRSGVAGFIASFPIPEVIRGINAFTLGMRRVNPEATVKVIWLNSWYDPGREREATEVLITQGADVINQFTDSGVPTQVAQDHNVFSISVGSDRSSYGPDAHLTSVVYQWGGFYTEIAKQVTEGTWRSRNVWGGLATGMIDIAPINPKVPENLAARVRRIRTEVAEGAFHPFTGPIRDQAGEVRVPQGTPMSDDELLRMDWYVEGIQGKLP